MANYEATTFLVSSLIPTVEEAAATWIEQEHTRYIKDCEFEVARAKTALTEAQDRLKRMKAAPRLTKPHQTLREALAILNSTSQSSITRGELPSDLFRFFL